MATPTGRPVWPLLPAVKWGPMNFSPTPRWTLMRICLALIRVGKSTTWMRQALTANEVSCTLLSHLPSSAAIYRHLPMEMGL
jgi:hypothetical protein